MAHYLEYVPDPNDPDRPDDHEFNGRWEFTCDSPPTAACRWERDCDCETWSLDIAVDGSWATHPYWAEDDDGCEIESQHSMAAIEGPHCNAYWWFDESDFRVWAEPPREGRQEITVEWDWGYEAYTFDYATEGSES
ncbi:MAG: hypothetical protein GC157_18555 [Frankiales bacterium]|nr:hypothetical protein [Frankiales bacterium]